MEVTIFAERIGKHLRAARMQHHMKQAAVAEALGMTTNSYSNIDRGVERPNLQRIAELCILYHLTPNDLLDDCCTEFIQMELPTEKVINKERVQLTELLNQCSDTIIHMIYLSVQAWHNDEKKR